MFDETGEVAVIDKKSGVMVADTTTPLPLHFSSPLFVLARSGVSDESSPRDTEGVDFVALQGMCDSGE